MVRLTREAILAASDLPSKELAVPEWGGSVLIRRMTGAMRDEWEQCQREAVGDDGKLVNIRALFASFLLVDEQGHRLFSPADIADLGSKSSLALDRIVDEGRRLNGIGAEAMEEAKGNFEPSRSDDSAST